MNNDLIVNLPFASTPTSEADYKKYPAEHSRSAGRAGFLKIDCLLNQPIRSFENLHRASRRASPNCVPSNGTKEMLHREHGGMFARIGTALRISRRGPLGKPLSWVGKPSTSRKPLPSLHTDQQQWRLLG